MRPVKKCPISLDVLALFFEQKKSKNFRVVEGLPKGARIVDAAIDREKNMINFLIESDAFDMVPVGGELPSVGIVIEENDHISGKEKS